MSNNLLVLRHHSIVHLNNSVVWRLLLSPAVQVLQLASHSIIFRCLSNGNQTEIFCLGPFQSHVLNWEVLAVDGKHLHEQEHCFGQEILI